MRPYKRFEVWLTASTDYVAARSLPRRIEDLASWDWIEYPPGLRLNDFLLEPLPASLRVEPRTSITLDSIMVAEELVLEGFGVLAIPREVIEPHLRNGRLVRLLPAIPLRPIATHAIWPANAGRDSPVRLLLDFMMEQALVGP